MNNTYDADQQNQDDPETQGGTQANNTINMNQPNQTQNIDGTFDTGKMNGTFDKGKMDGTFDKGKMDGTYDKGKMDGTFDKNKADGTVNKSKLDGTYDKSKADGTFDKGKKDGTFDKNVTHDKNKTQNLSRTRASSGAQNFNLSLSTSGSPRPGGYLTLGTQPPQGKPALNATGPVCKSPEKGSQTGEFIECTCLSEKCKELAKEARLAADAAEKQEMSPSKMKSYNYNEKKKAREAALKMCNLFAAMDGTPPPDNWDIVEDEDEVDRSRVRPYNPHPQTNLIVSTMSAVMLLAKGQQCKYKYMEAADTYLSTIKDEDGNAPPNVQGFLNLLHYKMIEARQKGWDKLDDHTYSTINDFSDLDETPPSGGPPQGAAGPSEAVAQPPQAANTTQPRVLNTTQPGIQNTTQPGSQNPSRRSSTSSKRGGGTKRNPTGSKTPSPK